MQQRRAREAEGFHLSLTEWVFVLVCVFSWGLASCCLGKDTGWDFRNYHWYDAYAVLHHRLGFDVAVAHQATFFNPLLHVPFYLLAEHGGSGLAVFYAGATQGLCVLPLYLLTRSAVVATDTLRRPRAAAGLLTLAGMAGSTLVSMVGKTSYDQSVLSLLVLAGLAVLIVGREALRAPSRRCAALAALAAAFVGMAVGLKLTEASFAVGLAAALALAPGSAAARALRLGAGALGGLLGVLATGGYWFLTLARATGNPVFPFFNDRLHSALLASGSYRDERFIPEGWYDTLTLPFRVLADYRVADDAPFHDLRLPLVYVLLPLAALLWAARRQAQQPLLRPAATCILFTFIAVSYAAWIDQFAVYRYLVLIEILAPLVITAAVGLLPVSHRLRVVGVGVLVVATLVTGRYEPGLHAHLGNPYVQIQGLSIPHPDTTMILMTGEQPLAYLIPSLPAEIPVLRIDGLLAGPFDGSGMTQEMQARVAAHRGDLFLIADRDEQKEAREAITAYHLRIVESECRRVTTNLGGPYQFCPLVPT